MALEIKDPLVERLARRLARQTGESVAEAIHRALEERLARVSRRSKQSLLLDSLADIRHRWAAMPQVDGRNSDEILGYDENGSPS
jgi:antitoxin VapB